MGAIFATTTGGRGALRCSAFLANNLESSSTVTSSSAPTSRPSPSPSCLEGKGAKNPGSATREGTEGPPSTDVSAAAAASSSFFSSFEEEEAEEERRRRRRRRRRGPRTPSVFEGEGKHKDGAKNPSSKISPATPGDSSGTACFPRVDEPVSHQTISAGISKYLLNDSGSLAVKNLSI